MSDFPPDPPPEVIAELLPRRHRQPPGANTLVIVLAAILGVMATVFVVIAVLALTKVNATAQEGRATADELARTIRAVNTSRREGARTACRNTESLKRGLRFVLLTFHVKPHELPEDPRIGRRPLAPIPGGCTRYAERIVRP